MGNVLNQDEKNLAIVILNNCAMARLKAKDYDYAKFDCTKALEYDDRNIKALFRRSQAKLALDDFQGAVDDLQRALEVDPENKEVQALKRKTQEQMRTMKKNE